MKIKIVAHRGKGPTSKYTDPGEELWLECLAQKMLENDLFVPQSILKNKKLGLPIGIPPENTIAAFKQGLEEGADAIELDVFLSKDKIPLAIHDNELNRNVSGARRAISSPDYKCVNDGYFGNVYDYDTDELKRLDMGDKNRIATLQEVIDFTILFNKVRIKKNQNPVILNIELKDKNLDNVQPILNVINKAIKEGKIEAQNVIYCSFDHGLLCTAIEKDSNAQIALALKTVDLFGEKNVNVEKGWTVALGKKYDENAIPLLQNKITEIVQNKKYQGSLIAMDAVLWDMETELVKLAKANNLDLHISTSDFREFEEREFIGTLLQISKTVQVYFKTDEPARIRHLLAEVEGGFKIDTVGEGEIEESKVLDLDDPKFDLDKESKNPEEFKIVLNDLKGLEINPDAVKEFKRLPKPGQETSEKYREYLTSYFDEEFRDFVTSKSDNELNIKKYITDSDIVNVLSGEDLKQYYEY